MTHAAPLQRPEVWPEARRDTMRRTLGLTLTLVVAVSLVLAGGGRAAAWSSTIWVNDDKPTQLFGPRNCNNPDYQQIQKAVNAAGPGDRINVCRGLYLEQVVFSGPSKSNIQLRSVDVWDAVIKAPPLQLDPYGIPDPTNNAIVKVSGSTNVTILAFTITGPRPPTWATGPFPLDQFSGVRVDSNGSANILGNHIIDIRDDPLSGAQHGVGIQVGRAAELTNGSAKIVGNVIERYQKNGMTVSGAASSGEVAYNRVLGIGPTPLIAQNGIQVSGGAAATLRHNFVSGNSYAFPTFASSGVILFSPGVVVVDRNTVNASDVGIFDLGAAPGSSITNNSVRASTYDGIDVDAATTQQRVEWNKSSQNSGPGIGLYDASDNAIRGNWIDRNKGSGIVLDIYTLGSNNNVVGRNFVTNNGTAGGDSTDGIRINAPSTGNTIEGNRLKRNVDHDCHDGSTGNTWTDNEAATSFPTGLCEDDEDADRGHDESDYGWDRSHSWNAEYNVPAEVDFTAAYGTVNVDGLLQLLPQLQVSTGRHVASPDN
jgi:parallel beta helix pectate lyase-like protein